MDQVSPAPAAAAPAILLRSHEATLLHPHQDAHLDYESRRLRDHKGLMPSAFGLIDAEVKIKINTL
jgi:hypothetical protein